ncbi:hypothetical protein Golax_002034, partial [Gossypium laxum]|nr:hypothetical protein [Gossypium laxum]
VNTSAYFFKKTQELIDFKEKRHTSFEYGRYGNPTTVVAEEKISALEGAESTLIMASGMCASTVMLMALVPAGGHIVTTTDCYRKTRIFIETILPKMGISATVIDPADMDGLESALNKNKVSSIESGYLFMFSLDITIHFELRVNYDFLAGFSFLYRVSNKSVP